MARQKRSYTAAFKAQIALAAIKGDSTANELAGKHGIHPTLVSNWKKALLDGAPGLFAEPGGKPARAADQPDPAELFEQIGRLKMELEWLKKNSLTAEHKRALIEPGRPDLSVRRQCELLGLSRSTFYYEPAVESPENLRLMGMIDREYTERPYYGSRRMTAWLNHDEGEQVNRKRVVRLMRLMGLEAIYPKPKLTAGNGHKVYPYLLRDVVIDRADQVWGTDITYVGLPGGFTYLAAVIDWHSRFVLSWELSNTLDGSFCLEALEAALSQGGRKPEVFNTDQGAQFTAEAFTGRLLSAGVKVSMDGKGRCLDNVFVERLWRSVKQEDVYLRGYETVPQLRAGLSRYFGFYNGQRRHQSLGYRTPAEVYAAAG